MFHNPTVLLKESKEVPLVLKCCELKVCVRFVHLCVCVFVFLFL